MSFRAVLTVLVSSKVSMPWIPTASLAGVLPGIYYLGVSKVKGISQERGMTGLISQFFLC